MENRKFTNHEIVFGPFSMDLAIAKMTRINTARVSVTLPVYFPWSPQVRPAPQMAILKMQQDC